MLKAAEFQFGKLAILIGPNRTGKSSVLQALAFLRQSALERRLASYGPVIDLGPLQDLVYRRRANARVRIELSWKVDRAVAEAIPDGSTVQYALGFYASGEWEQAFEVRRNGDVLVHLASGTPGQKSDKVTLPLIGREGELLLYPGNSPGYPVGSVNPNLPAGVNHRAERALAHEFAEFAAGLVRNFRLVPAVRGLSETEYDTSGVGKEDIKHSGDLPGAMGASPEAAEEARVWTEVVVGAGSRVRLTGPGKMALESIRESDAFNLVNEGTGLNQLTHLLFVLARAEPGQVIGIEEPELSLHPAAQARLADLLVRLAQERGLQLIMTTHSEHLLMALLIAVAEQRLRPEELSVHYFQREDGSATARQVAVSAYGQLEGGLPGFFEAEADQLAKFLVALAAR